MKSSHNEDRRLSSLTEREKKVVFECLRAASDGPFFSDSEFATLFGLERAQVREMAKAASHSDDSRNDAALAINNALANLLGYPHHQERVWSQFISVPEEEVRRIFTKWRGDQPFN